MEKTKKITIGFVLITFIVIATSIIFLQYESENVLFISTTTSVENTGLLDFIIEKFESQNNINVKVTARGSGVAIDLARRGEVDAVLVHAPGLEQDFVNEGYGINRTTLWFNFFVVIGPSNDPADISHANNASDAFQRIYSAGKAGIAQFYSRGDQSGTHLRELEVWQNASLKVSASDEDWYFETGSGMSTTITIANENDAYTLSDLGTFTQMKGSDTLNLQLETLFSGDQVLYNPYSYIVVNPQKYENLNTEAALLFLQFLSAKETQDLVRNYKVNDVSLFTPIP